MTDAGGTNSTYTLEIKNDEALLTVFPPEPDKSKCNSHEVKKDLESKGINWIDQKLLEEAVREASGSPICVGRKVAEDAKVEVRIEKGAMAAYATVVPPSGEGALLTIEKAKRDLELEGVTYGVKEDVLKELVESKKYNQDVLIAEGKPNEKGTDGYIEYHFEREGEHVHKKDEYGRVDHYDLGLFQSVVEEQLLATLHPSMKGHAGLTVLGDVIPEIPVQEAKLSAGRNARMSPEGDKVYSEINGLVKLVGGQVGVDPVLEIKGWVGGDTGNIEFVGDIIIRGGVEDGFKVTATENINIENAVGKAHVEAGGDVYVKGGIMGKTEGTVIAGKNLHARFIQEAIVAARNEIHVDDAIMHSQVDAGSAVYVGLGGSAKGLIVGGKLRATREIACKVMGSPMTTKTFIEVGYNPRMRERLVELEGNVAVEKDNFDKVKKGIQTIETLKQRSRGNLPADKEKILASLREAQEGLKLKLRDLIEELKSLQEQIAHSKAGRVSVEEDIFPGTKIAIRSAVLFVNVKQSKVTFIAERAEVVPRTHITPRPGATVEDDLKQLEEIKAMEAAGEQLV